MTEELDLYDGCLTAGGAIHRNWLRLPHSAKGDVTLWFGLRASGERLDFTGRDVTVEIVGEGEFVEKLSDDMRPAELG